MILALTRTPHVRRRQSFEFCASRKGRRRAYQNARVRVQEKIYAELGQLLPRGARSLELIRVDSRGS